MAGAGRSESAGDDDVGVQNDEQGLGSGAVRIGAASGAAANLMDHIGRQVERLFLREAGTRPQSLKGAQPLTHNLLHDVGVAPPRPSGSHSNLANETLVEGKGRLDPCHNSILP